MIHLDSNAAIALLSGQTGALRTRFHSARDAGETRQISSVVYHELMYGAAASRKRVENEEKLAIFLSSGGIDVDPFTTEDARRAADIRADLRRKGTPIGPYDLFIAAHALRSHAVLVTANIREFSRVAGLNCIDWSS